MSTFLLLESKVAELTLKIAKNVLLEEKVARVHTEKKRFKILPFVVQQLVPGAVPLKGYICTFYP